MLGGLSVRIHREFITVAARWIMEANLKQRRMVPTLFLALVCLIAFLTELAAEASLRNRGQLVGKSINSIMTRYGLPAHITKLDRNRAAYHWQFKASIFEESDNSRAGEFQCEVTVVTSPRGKVIEVLTNVSNAGAGVLAATGALGPLCDGHSEKSPNPRR